ncbi:MAG: hypothetical protein WCH39_21345 [Schlesneria sp.]
MTIYGPKRTSSKWIWLAVVCLICGNGCATVPYGYSRFHPPEEDGQAEVVFDYGQPQKTLDNIAWFTGIWSRILSLNSHVNNHDLTDETRAKLTAYLEENDLTDVLVRVNQYDPKGEWRRLRENRRVAAGWRYSAGLVSIAHYTLLPGRVFGGDTYNPFTNSLYINSDVSAVVLHEAAYAKDIHSQSHPGTYAVFNELPVMSLWRHTKGVNDILGYARTNDDWTIERETYRVVYPQMGVHSMSLTGTFVPWWEGILFTVAGATAGHVTGQVAISIRKKERDAQQEELELEEVPESEPILATSQESNEAKSTIQFIDHSSESPPNSKLLGDDDIPFWGLRK